MVGDGLRESKGINVSDSTSVAIIGGGISGLGAAWALHRSNIDFTLFEASDRPGGHARTHTLQTAAGELEIDVGVLGFLPNHYPNLMALIDELNVELISTPISMLYWDDSGESWGTFEKTSPLWKRLESECHRFNRDMRRLKNSGSMEATFQTVGEFLRANDYSDDFAHKALAPVLNMGLDQGFGVFDSSLLVCQEFFTSGGFSFNIPTDWYSWKRSSRNFFETVMSPFEEDVLLATPVEKVIRRDDHVTVTTTDGQKHQFDFVVFSTETETALKLLESPSREESQVLSGFDYNELQLVLHQDESILCPHVLCGGRPVVEFRDEVHTFNLIEYFRLHDYGQPLLETLGSQSAMEHIDPSQILARFDFRWDRFTPDNVLRKSRFFHLQGRNRTWYCGSPFVLGFHEDCLVSGLVVASQLGATYPFTGLAIAQRVFDFNESLMLRGDTSYQRF